MSIASPIVRPNLAPGKYHGGPPIILGLRYKQKMKRNPTALTVLATNLRAVIDASGDLPTQWAKRHSMPPRNVNRILRAEQSPSLDTLQELADAAGLLAWQLLTPGLDPRNPPVVTMSQTERDFYKKLREDLANLPPK